MWADCVGLADCFLSLGAVMCTGCLPLALLALGIRWAFPDANKRHTSRRTSYIWRHSAGCVFPPAACLRYSLGHWLPGGIHRPNEESSLIKHTGMTLGASYVLATGIYGIAPPVE